MDPATVHFLLGQAPAAVLALVGLWLFTVGRMHSDGEMKTAISRADAERDRALDDLRTERAAHEHTRAALAAASARADTGVRAAELIAYAMEGSRVATQAQALPPGREP